MDINSVQDTGNQPYFDETLQNSHLDFSDTLSFNFKSYAPKILALLKVSRASKRIKRQSTATCLVDHSSHSCTIEDDANSTTMNIKDHVAMTKAYHDAFMAAHPHLNGLSEFSKEDQHLYKCHLEQGPFVRCTDLLSRRFMDFNYIDDDEEILMIASEDFLPRLAGYKGPVTQYTKFYFLLLRSQKRLKKYRRIFECRHVTRDGVTCGTISCDLHKQFAHSSVHTRQKPYICPYPGCTRKYAQRGNYNRHYKENHGEEVPEASKPALTPSKYQ